MIHSEFSGHLFIGRGRHFEKKRYKLDAQRFFANISRRLSTKAVMFGVYTQRVVRQIYPPTEGEDTFGPNIREMKLIF